MLPPSFGAVMRASWTLVTAPQKEPVSLDLVRLHCRVDSDDYNVLLDHLARTARQAVERYTSRALLTQTWRLVIDEWPEGIDLPMAAPLQAITSVQYYNSAGTLTTLSSSAYLRDTTSEPARLLETPNGVWPSLQADRDGAIEITYTAGWTRAEDVPAPLVQAILILVARLLEDPTSEVKGGLPDAVEALAAPYRVWVAQPCE